MARFNGAASKTCGKPHHEICSSVTPRFNGAASKTCGKQSEAPPNECLFLLQWSRK